MPVVPHQLKRLGAVFAVVAIIATARVAHSATIVITAESEGDTIDIRASAYLQADAETAWHVLTAYDRYVDFIPDLRTSRVIARQGATVTVEQSGDARVWLLPVPLDLVFEIVESRPTGLHSHTLSGALPALENNYLLTPGEHGVWLDYVGRVGPELGPFGRVKLQTVKQNVARQFQALADEIERQSAAAVAN